VGGVRREMRGATGGGEGCGGVRGERERERERGREITNIYTYGLSFKRDLFISLLAAAPVSLLCNISQPHDRR